MFLKTSSTLIDMLIALAMQESLVKLSLDVRAILRSIIVVYFRTTADGIMTCTGSLHTQRPCLRLPSVQYICDAGQSMYKYLSI